VAINIALTHRYKLVSFLNLIFLKKEPKLFSSELRQMSTNFDNFWHKDGQDDEIMRSRPLMPLSASGVVVLALVSGHTGHTSSINSDNFEMQLIQAYNFAKA